MFSFIGTFIAIISSTLMFFYLGKLDQMPDMDFRQSFAFSSLISSTDPVSVISIFRFMNADMNLYAIIFGEAFFNDAIGVVMYREINKTDFNYETL